ncbi:hypothetical protein GCM10023335_38730 [Streptomyces siamensis]|uniref:TerD domain-containing protein n=1 Tax=Streptomyces siamensis TaxID=1274986 RepID=A0ABP9IYG1_9ACTN
MNDVQAFGTVGRGHDLETLQFEVDPDQLPDDLVVVHNKHSAGRAWHNSRVGPRPLPRPGFPDFRPCGARASPPAGPPGHPRPAHPTPHNTTPPTTKTRGNHPGKSW